MSGIRSKDTKPEVAIRKALFALGFRYRLHKPNLPGKPDIVLPKYHATIFVHGCFWHGHKCSLFKWPKSNEAFWRKKIEGNKARDLDTQKRLRDAGWRILVVWECAVRKSKDKDFEGLLDRIAGWITGNSIQEEIPGEEQ